MSNVLPVGVTLPALITPAARTAVWLSVGKLLD